MIKKFLHKMRGRAVFLNKNNILSLLESNKNAKVIDLGCDDGMWTLKMSDTIGTKQIYGFDIIDERLIQAKNKGIQTKKGNLNKPLPYENNSFDCVHADQVIEHLVDIDLFVQEIHRILKKDGYAIISTENLASWCNIASLIFGWQPFSITNVSKKRLGLGNPFAVSRGVSNGLESWLHIKVMAYQALKELFVAHGFKVEKIAGAGYFPLPAFLGNIDIRHAHFITFKIRKTISQ